MTAKDVMELVLKMDNSIYGDYLSYNSSEDYEKSFLDSCWNDESAHEQYQETEDYVCDLVRYICKKNSIPVSEDELYELMWRK